jgi:MoaA/NifB/PqqE/SkfB family radical SAM enzyme
MGDLNESSIEEIWNNQAYRSLRASMVGLEDLNNFCKKCNDVQRFL